MGKGSRAVKKVNTASNGVMPVDIDLLAGVAGDEITRADTHSRNVKFDINNPMTTKNTQMTAMFGGNPYNTSDNRSMQQRNC